MNLFTRRRIMAVVVVLAALVTVYIASAAMWHSTEYTDYRTVTLFSPSGPENGEVVCSGECSGYYDGQPAWPHAFYYVESQVVPVGVAERLGWTGMAATATSLIFWLIYRALFPAKRNPRPILRQKQHVGRLP